MIVLEELLLEVKKYESLLIELKELCKIESYEEELKEKERHMAFDDFWNDIENSQKIMQEVKNLRDKISLFTEVEGYYEETVVMIEMALEEKEEDLIIECKELYETFLTQYNKVNLSSLYIGEYDDANAIITIHAGAGGTESCDWVSILFRMYSRYAQKNGFKVSILDKLDGDEAGIKSVTLEVSGDFSYGNLKGEKGVHRLVRISPFDSSGRRHTSFASVDVMPVIEDDGVIEINNEDLRIDTYRASGAGGQHINTTDSAIRITHLPTNIVVQCQNERSQHKNKDMAMKMLKAKLFENQELERKEKLKDIRGEVMQNAFGSQTRSYVFHPYNLVKDHITLEETGNINSVIDGDLDKFILSYLKWLNTME
ncbi:MAG: peptide chain release factor 2 [Lachnospirales bacterium]